MWLLILFSVFWGSLSAQQDNGATATFDADLTTPFTGEAVLMTLQLEMPAAYDLIEWPEIPANWGGFVVSDQTPMKTETLADGQVRYTQTFTARIWRPGDYATPETFIGYQRPGEDSILRIPVRSVFFSVPTILDRDDLILRPYLPPKAVFFVPLWLIAVSGVAVIGGGVIGWRWWAWKQSQVVDETQITLTPAQAADDRLKQLQPATMRAYDVAVVIADTITAFISARYRVDIAGMTTAEIAETLQTRETRERVERIQRILTRLDLIKFTGLSATHDELERLVTSTRRWIADVDLDHNMAAEIQR